MWFIKDTSHYSTVPPFSLKVLSALASIIDNDVDDNTETSTRFNLYKRSESLKEETYTRLLAASPLSLNKYTNFMMISL